MEASEKYREDNPAILVNVTSLNSTQLLRRLLLRWCWRRQDGFRVTLLAASIIARAL